MGSCIPRMQPEQMTHLLAATILFTKLLQTSIHEGRENAMVIQHAAQEMQGITQSPGKAMPFHHPLLLLGQSIYLFHLPFSPAAQGAVRKSEKSMDKPES